MPDHFDDMDLDGLRREAERLGYPAWLATPSGRKMAIWHGDEAAALRWLLRQPEALARAACYARGVAEERARHEATGAHACGALYPGPDGGRLVACTALVPGPRWCREHEVPRG